VVATTMKGLKFEVFLRSGRPSRQPDLQVGAKGGGARRATGIHMMI
jgi:hypothetical protein